MPISISDLAHSVRTNSAAAAIPVSLGHSQQLVVAALGYKALASYQAAQRTAQECQDLANTKHVVIDYDMLDQRADELGVAPTTDQLHELIYTAFQERAPHIRAYDSCAALGDYLQEHVNQVAIEDDNVNGEIDNANYDGIDEVYFDFKIELENIPVGDSVNIDLYGHVSLGIDTERPYSGHIVNIEGYVSMPRLGRQCFGSVDCLITKAELDTELRDGGPPVRSMSKAYADLLGLELHEADNFADVEPEPRDGHNGEMVYSYILDFTHDASPEIAQKILQRHSSLRIEVGPNFFDNVRGL